MQDYNVSLNFNTKLYGYVAAYEYVIKEKDSMTVLQSQEHTIKIIRSSKTKNVFKKFSGTFKSQREEKIRRE